MLEENAKNEQLKRKQKEKDRIAQAVKDREEAVGHRDRLSRMKVDKDNFMATLLTQRKAQLEKKLKGLGWEVLSACTLVMLRTNQF